MLKAPSVYSNLRFILRNRGGLFDEAGIEGVVPIYLICRVQ